VILTRAMKGAKKLYYQKLISNVITIIQFNSILYYLYAESTATRPITDTAQRFSNYNNNIKIKSKIKQCNNNNDDDDDDDDDDDNKPIQAPMLIIN
jgi:type II secretory pathway component PulC